MATRCPMRCSVAGALGPPVTDMSDPLRQKTRRSSPMIPSHCAPPSARDHSRTASAWSTYVELEPDVAARVGGLEGPESPREGNLPRLAQKGEHVHPDGERFGRPVRERDVSGERQLPPVDEGEGDHGSVAKLEELGVDVGVDPAERGRGIIVSGLDIPEFRGSLRSLTKQ